MAKSANSIPKSAWALSGTLSNFLAALSLFALVVITFQIGPSRAIGLILDYYDKLISVLTWPFRDTLESALAWLNAHFGMKLSLVDQWRYILVTGLVYAGILARSVRHLASRIIAAVSLPLIAVLYSTNILSHVAEIDEYYVYFVCLTFMLLPLIPLINRRLPQLRIPGFTSRMEGLLPMDDDDERNIRRNSAIVLLGTLFLVAANAGLSTVGL